MAPPLVGFATQKWAARTLVYVALCFSPMAFAQSGQTRHEEFQIQINDAYQDRIEKAMHALEADPYLKGTPHDQLRKVAEFTMGNVLYVVLHELGHAIMDDLRLYVLGREEDAADSFATVAMLRIGGLFSQRVLEEAAKGWFYADARERAQRRKFEFYDSHSLDQQRAYQIVCLMVGSDPDKFKQLADETKMPDERQDSCRFDYSTASWSWGKALDSHRRAPEAAAPTDFTVLYGEPSGDMVSYARFLRSARLMEIVAEHTADELVLKAPVTLAAQVCGEPNARWNRQTRTIVLCYETAYEFAQLYRDFAPEWKVLGRQNR